MSETTTREFADPATDPKVRGFLHLPDKPSGYGLVLAHGAGSNANAPLLIAIADTFRAAGFAVLRCDLPYRQVRSWGPPGPGDAARDRAGLKNAVAALQKIVSGSNDAGGSSSLPTSPPRLESIYLGGHSYGGRQSSMLCAEQPDLVAGLLLLSYPLHPPRKPEQQRTQHLPNLGTPTLFVHGTRDPFGSIAEIAQALKMIPAKTKLLTIEGAGHDLGFKAKAKERTLPALICSEFAAFFYLSS